MRHTFISKLKFRVPVEGTVIELGASWLLVIIGGLWAIDTIYVPILGSFLNRTQAWTVTVIIVLLIGVALVVHFLAHVYAARLLGNRLPSRTPQYLPGDAAQVWPAAVSPWREALAAIAGPLANILLAGLSYFIWNAQLNTYLNLSMLFFGFFNMWMAIINLIPAFPFDGGRLVRAIVWGLLRRPTITSRLGMRLGLLVSVALTGWGIFLITQQVRFSTETGGVTILFAAIILVALSMQPAWEWNRPVLASKSGLMRKLIRVPIAGLLLIGLIGVPSGLALTNNGLEAPGVALSVEPMVEVPAQHRYPPNGSFILTTVIPQTPITVAEWVYGKLSPVIRIVPPEQIVPAGTTPQEMAKQGTQMMNQSEITATVVGLQLAGYDVKVESKGVEVVKVLPDSPNKDVLQAGDVITAMNGQPIRTTSDLINQIKAQNPHATMHLQIERAGRTLEVAAPLMPPTGPNDPPRLGIEIESAGFNYKLPFPVNIVPEKIVGGPSAGLMFTLTVYNMITPNDLTGGRKIAGTGTINLDGTVGPIGGVEQKVAAAEGAGAEYFLSPPENYAAALSVARHIKVVKISTAKQAIEFLQSLPPINK